MHAETSFLADLQVILITGFERGAWDRSSASRDRDAIDAVQAAIEAASRTLAALGEQPPAPDTLRARWSGKAISLIRGALFWLFPQITRSDAAVLETVTKLARVVRENEREMRMLSARLARLEEGELESSAPIPDYKETAETGMITRQDVLYAYRLLLGREPENEQVIEDHLDLPNLTALRERFIAAPEFVSMRIPVPANPLAKVARHDIEVDAGPKLKALLDRVYRIWSRLGEEDPFYSVLTFDRFHQDQIAENLDEFYSSGARDIERLMLCFERNQTGSGIRQVVELGCGVGRLTSLLAAKFPSVLGLDVSNAHLELAREHCRRREIRNADFRQVRSVEDLDELPPIDLFFSLIVLQHNPPPVIVALLERIFSRVAPGGIVYFQVPTLLPGYRFRVDEYLRQPEATVIEMHAVPQREILRLLDQAGLRLIEIVEDDCTGIQGGISNTFVAQKN
jgi:SAM-dependent methyltransferase